MMLEPRRRGTLGLPLLLGFAIGSTGGPLALTSLYLVQNSQVPSAALLPSTLLGLLHRRLEAGHVSGREGSKLAGSRYGTHLLSLARSCGGERVLDRTRFEPDPPLTDAIGGKLTAIDPPPDGGGAHFSGE